MFSFRSAMIQIEPAATRSTMRMPSASARTLLVLSGPVVICRKNTRCTPIWATARTAKPQKHAGRPEQRRVGDPKRYRRQGDCKNQSNRVDSCVGQRFAFCPGQRRAVSWRAIEPRVTHGRTPIR